jgi:hypothetical protein
MWRQQKRPLLSAAVSGLLNQTGKSRTMRS